MSERREWWIIEDGPQQIARTRKLYDRPTIHVREVLPGDDELTNYQLQSALMQLQDDHAKLVEAAKKLRDCQYVGGKTGGWQNQGYLPDEVRKAMQGIVKLLEEEGNGTQSNE